MHSEIEGLLQTLSMVRTDCDGLAKALEEAAARLKTPGILPPPSLDDRLDAARNAHAGLASRITSLAQGRGSDIAWKPTDSLQAMEGWLKATETQDLEAIGTARATLGKLLQIQHCAGRLQEELASLKGGFAAILSALDEPIQPEFRGIARDIAGGSHPAAALFQLIGRSASLDENEQLPLAEAAQKAYGLPIMLAAVAGRLRLAAEVGAASKENIPAGGPVPEIILEDNSPPTAAMPEPPGASTSCEASDATLENAEEPLVDMPHLNDADDGGCVQGKPSAFAPTDVVEPATNSLQVPTSPFEPDPPSHKKLTPTVIQEFIESQPRNWLPPDMMPRMPDLSGDLAAEFDSLESRTESGNVATRADEPRSRKPSGDAIGTPRSECAGQASAGRTEGIKTAQPSQREEDPPPARPVPAPQIPVLAAAEAEPLLLKMVGDGDLAGAYWLARSVESSGGTPPCPSWLLAAAQGALWEPGDDSALATDLFDITTAQQDWPEGLPCQLLRLAAALYPALTEPLCNTAVWLETALPFPELYAIAENVRVFARYGRKLRKEDVGNRQGREQLEAAIGDVAAEASRWLRDASHRRTKLYRANHIWSCLVSQGGEIHRLLAPVAGDRRSQAGEVRDIVRQWSRTDEVRRRLDAQDRQLHGRHVRMIQASPRNQLIGWIDEACRLAQRWADAVESANRLASTANWADEQVDRLAEGLSARMAGAVREMKELIENDASDAAVAAAKCVQNALAKIGSLLDQGASSLAGGIGGVSCPFDGIRDSQSRGLWQTLKKRLWWTPEIRLDDEGTPLPEELPRIAAALQGADSDSRSLSAAIEKWMEMQDFRFTKTMMGALADDDELNALDERHRLLLEQSRHRLQAAVDQAEVAIEKALSDGVILEIDRSKPQGILASICAAETVAFAPAFAKLREVEDFLRTRQSERLDYQRKAWERQRNELLPSHAGAEVAKIIEFIEGALDRGDTRVVAECISRLQEAREHGSQPAMEWFITPDDSRDALNSFLTTCATLEQALGDARVSGAEAVLRLLRRSGVSEDSLPSPRIEEVERALTAWRNLKRADVQGAAGHRTSLLRILSFLGLEPTTSGDAVTLSDSRNGWAHYHAKVSARGLSPVPQFGSFREDDYDVVCLWERPGALTLSARLNEARLGKQPTIVLYLGRLKTNQRLSFARHAHQGEKLQIVVIDEVLLTYLAGERDARLPVCFSIALPFTTLNPYTPDSAGNVPPEMFVGRADMLRALQDTGGNGSCLVYGGRQLGKSALLRRAQREFHNPDQGKYAIYEDIKLIGDPQAGCPAEHVWNRIRERLKDLSLIPRNVTTEKPDQIARYIREAIEQDSRRRIIVLLDEADCFLDQDAAQQFKNVVELKRLMEDSNRRFKVVFAGLHNVQRFQGIPNQPLAHLGSPLRVGPMDPLSARQLVKRPLEIMGYRFADDALILRILSYTNYHPGLIQLFCSKLLDNLHKGVHNGPPRYEITADMVHSVYSDESVRRDIRDRFNWTLGLDIRYKAIAWTIIADQYSERDSFSRQYPSRILFDRVRDNWPAGFQGLSGDLFRGLLDEMCGLGLLIRTGDGYRLRSPNLVHLVGTEDEIELLLMELRDQPAPNQVFCADSFREPLDVAAGLYSPFTFAQARSLARPVFGVGLIFGSAALSLGAVGEAIKRFIPTDLPEGVQGNVAKIDKVFRAKDSFSAWLQSHCSAHAKHERLIVTYHAQSNAEEVADLVEAAIAFCKQKQRKQRQWMRILFVFDPAAHWQWLRLPEQRRKAIEEECDAMIHLKRWDGEGTRVRLNIEQKMESVDVCRRIEEVTGGWPFLLDEVFRHATGVDPRPAVDRVASQLAQEGGLRQRFVAALGLDATPIAQRVVALFRYWEGAIDNDMLSEAIKERSEEQRGAGEEEFRIAVAFLSRLGVLEEDARATSLQSLVHRTVPQP